MAQKQCDECGEAVDEAKAFCPQCGHAFVEEEKRDEASVFESMEGTMQFGQTMYNQMLSDMGLNIKDMDLPKEIRDAEPDRPLAPAVETLKPIEVPSAPAATSEPDKSEKKVRVIGIAAAFLILMIIIVVITAAAVWLRYY